MADMHLYTRVGRSIDKYYIIYNIYTSSYINPKSYNCIKTSKLPNTSNPHIKPPKLDSFQHHKTLSKLHQISQTLLLCKIEYLLMVRIGGLKLENERLIWYLILKEGGGFFRCIGFFICVEISSCKHTYSSYTYIAYQSILEMPMPMPIPIPKFPDLTSSRPISSRPPNLPHRSGLDSVDYVRGS